METNNIAFLCEVVKFKKAIEKILISNKSLPLLQESKQKRLQMACNRMEKMIQQYCDDNTIELLSDEDYLGKEYTEGLPLDPINLDDFEGDNILYIETILEPVVKAKGNSDIIKNGKVILSDQKPLELK